MPLPRALVGRVPRAPRRADGRRGLLPPHRRAHRRRGDARALRTAVRRRRCTRWCARRRRSTASSSRRSSARSPDSRAFARAAKAAGVRLACATAGDPDNIAFARRRAATARLLRRRGRRARRRARQARARSLPARGAAHRRRAGAVPRVRGCAARHRRRAPRRDARRRDRVERFPPTSSARPPRRRAGGRTSRRWTRGVLAGRTFRLNHATESHAAPWKTPIRHAPAGRRRKPDHRRAPRRSSRRCARRASAFPNDFRRDALAADLHAQYGAKTNEELEPLAIAVAVAGRMMLKRVMGKASFATLQDMTGRIQLYVTADAVGADAHDAFKHWDLGDLVGATGHVFKTRTGELSIKVSVDPPAGEGAAAAAGEVPRARRPGAALPPALRRPHHQPGVARRVRQALADRAGDPRVLRRARLSRGRDADDAPDSGRRRGAAVRHAPQRARHGALPAHRAGAVPEEARRRRPREGVRDQPQFPERRHLDAAQPRVHDARVLRGLPGLPLPDGPHRGAVPRGRDEGRRHDDASPTRA